MNAGRLAYASVRAHAARGRLVGDEAMLRLRLAEDARERAGALVQLGLGDGTGVGAFRELFARLVEDYARALRSMPGDAEPLSSLLARHELENLKLVYRACVRSLPRARVAPWWRPLGALAVLDAAAWQEVRALPQMIEAAKRTPYRTAVAMLAQAADPAMAELGLDRFATQRIAAAARASERDVAALLLAVVRERDAEVRRRAAAYGLDDDAGRRLAVLDGERARPVDELREERRRACWRALRSGRLSRVPWLALLLLEEDRLAQVIALAEAG